MPLFNVKITQVFKVQKSLALQLEAKSQDDLLDALDAGEYDLPSAESPAWVIDHSSVEHEETQLA